MAIDCWRRSGFDMGGSLVYTLASVTMDVLLQPVPPVCMISAEGCTAAAQGKG